MVLSSISLSISFVLMIYDEFTNLLLDTNMVKIKADKDQKLVKKERCIVFLECGKKKIDIEIENPLYIPQTISIDIQKLQGDTPIVKAWMFRNSIYPILSGTTCIIGNANSGSLISAFCLKQAAAIRLLKDYNREMDIITIYYSDNLNLEGKTFLIQNEEKGESEYCCIENIIDSKESSYRLKQPLNHSYTKIGTSLIPAFSGMADRKGYYILPIKELEVSECQCICQLLSQNETEKIQKTITLKNRCINRLDW